MNESFSIEITTEHDTAVYYKEDGGRFSGKQSLKLCANCNYCIKIIRKEELSSTDLMVNGVTVFLQLEEKDGNKIYSSTFNTDLIDITKKNKRDVLALQVPIQGGLQVGLQAKYYGKSKGHCTWGTVLKSISVQYKDSEGIPMVQDIRYRAGRITTT